MNAVEVEGAHSELTTECRAHSQNTKLSGGPRCDFVATASLAGAFKWRVVVVEFVAYHKMEHIHEPFGCKQ